MRTVYKFKTKPHSCQYLPDQVATTAYELVDTITPVEYQALLNQGWRKFGGALFRPVCQACSACQSIRVLVADFEPNRSQRRVRKANIETKLVIDRPTITHEKLNLYYRHHMHHAEQKGWPTLSPSSTVESISNMIETPMPIEEWQFHYDGTLIAIAYVDPLPDGLSGVYFYFEPECRELSPGTWIILSMIERAQQLKLNYVYLGFYVKNCRSMEYKGKFFPSEILGTDGAWHSFNGDDISI